MADDRGLVRSVAWLEVFPWLILLRTIRMAADFIAARKYTRFEPGAGARPQAMPVGRQVLAHAPHQVPDDRRPQHDARGQERDASRGGAGACARGDRAQCDVTAVGRRRHGRQRRPRPVPMPTGEACVRVVVRAPG